MNESEQETPTECIEAAEHELHVISEIMEAISVAAGSCEVKIESAWMSWLGDRVREQAARIEEAEMQRQRQAA